MSVGNVGMYRDSGRLRGTYLYMLLCRDCGPIYVKVGITDDLYARLLALRNGCPITPRRFCMMEFPSRRKALKAETALHKSFGRWAAHGEWFRVPAEDKAPFNEAWRTGLVGHITPEWPDKWDQVAVEPIIKLAEQRQQYVRKKILRRGLAYLDGRKAGLQVFGHFGT